MLCSQAACERTIGLVKAELKSHKDVFETVRRRTILVDQLHRLDFLLDPELKEATPDRADGDDSDVEDEDDGDVGEVGTGVASGSGDSFREPGHRHDPSPSYSMKLGKSVRLDKTLLTERVQRNLRAAIQEHRSASNDPAAFTFHASFAVNFGHLKFRVKSRASFTTKTPRAACRVAIKDEAELLGVAFFDVYAFAFPSSDQTLLAVGRRLLVDAGPHSVTNQWVCGDWSASFDTTDAMNLLELMGQVDTGVRHYLFPRKTAMGGFVAWWADFCRQKAAAGRRVQRSTS
ncbi:hypothetical protein OC842_004197 [Tilletia horrida]|uniref:Uncharacterized protein n=1 Tax=Tilletia horrida TaxID=155126 RepID=A0AAN6GCK1_9BASI|nr:hypothetical protein OC842_004197 [Tilletia horrida]